MKKQEKKGLEGRLVYSGPSGRAKEIKDVVKKLYGCIPDKNKEELKFFLIYKGARTPPEFHWQQQFLPKHPPKYRLDLYVYEEASFIIPYLKPIHLNFSAKKLREGNIESVDGDPTNSSLSLARRVPDDGIETEPWYVSIFQIDKIEIALKEDLLKDVYEAIKIKNPQKSLLLITLFENIRHVLITLFENEGKEQSHLIPLKLPH